MPTVTTQAAKTQKRVEEIRNLHASITQRWRTSVDDAIRIGELLTEQKEELGHGNWGAWLKANVKFSTATARNYMRLYKHRDKVKTLMLSNLVSSLKALQGILSEPDPDPKEYKVEYTLTAEEKEAYEDLVSYLMEKVFRVTTPKDVVLAALRFTKSIDLLEAQGAIRWPDQSTYPPR